MTDSSVGIQSSNSVFVQGKTPWKIATAICVQRFPIISEEKCDLEKRFFDMKVCIT